MILVQETYSLGPFEFTSFKSYYYKNLEAQKNNKKTWFKYIDRISLNQYGAPIISGKAGTKEFYFYTVKQAIKKYNQLAREA